MLPIRFKNLNPIIKKIQINFSKIQNAKLNKNESVHHKKPIQNKKTKKIEPSG